MYYYYVINHVVDTLLRVRHVSPGTFDGHMSRAQMNIRYIIRCLCGMCAGARAFRHVWTILTYTYCVLCMCC